MKEAREIREPLLFERRR